MERMTHVGMYFANGSGIWEGGDYFPTSAIACFTLATANFTIESTNVSGANYNVVAIRAAATAINKAGGVHGRPVQVSGRFGGLTAYSRSPARGLWKSGAATHLDDIVVLEVMTPRINRAWWKKYRRSLERTFRQDEIILRIQDITVL